LNGLWILDYGDLSVYYLGETHLIAAVIQTRQKPVVHPVQLVLPNFPDVEGLDGLVGQCVHIIHSDPRLVVALYASQLAGGLLLQLLQDL